MSRLGPLLLLLASAAAAADADAPFLWQVQGPRATHYLLGSIHLLPDSEQDLPDGIAAAYDASDGVVFETDIGAMMDPQTQLTMLAAARSEGGIRSEIGDKLYAQLVKYAHGLEMPMSVCEPFKAWFCAMSLEIFNYRKAGFSGANGIDEQIYGWAKDDGKNIHWLESPDAQIALFSTMPEPMAREFLSSEMDGAGTSADDPAELMRAWRDNDVVKLEGLIRDFRTRYPATYERLLANRNRDWLPQLKRILDGASPRLVVVGAAHCIGRDGLIAQLTAHGYKVLPYLPPQSQVVTMAGPHQVRTALRR
jgi:uncharacterized protein YbaP (TraB family)